MAPVRGHNEGTLFYRKRDQRWVASVTMPDGSRPSRSHPDKAEARRLLRELLKRREQGLRGRDESLGHFLERWLADVRPRLAPATWRKHASVIRVHLAPALGHRRLSELSVADVRSLLTADSALDPQTRRHHRSTLRRALADALRDGLVTRNVAALAEPPPMKTKERTWLDAKQVTAMIGGTREDRMHALYVLVLTAGLRESEALALAWPDVDLDAATVRVHRTLHRSKPGDADYDPRDPWVFRPTKTDRSRRTVSLAPVTVDALREHRVRQLEERAAAGKLGEGLVFTTPTGQPIHGTNLLPDWYAHLARLGLPRITIHDARHSAATVMHAAGVPLEVIADMLGHSTVRVTADLYRHRVPQLQRDAAAAMQRAVGR